MSSIVMDISCNYCYFKKQAHKYPKFSSVTYFQPVAMTASRFWKEL